MKATGDADVAGVDCDLELAVLTMLPHFLALWNSLNCCAVVVPAAAVRVGYCAGILLSSVRTKQDKMTHRSPGAISPKP